MSTYALETTKDEIENGYRDLNRLLNGTQGAYAVRAALGLAKIDAAELWKFLKSYASTDLNYRDTEHLLVVNALYNLSYAENWRQGTGQRQGNIWGP